MHSSSIREKAQKLRLQGKSYNEISEDLHIAKSTLYSWFSNLQLSTKAQNRIQKRVHEGSLKGLLKRNRLQTHLARQRAAQNRQYGEKKIGSLSKQELLIIGAALYWGEGYKKPLTRNNKILTHHPVSLSNSDPHIIRIFLRFLRECFGVQDENITIDIRIYEHMNEAEQFAYWQEVTQLPAKNFSPAYYGVSISSKRRKAFNRLPYGTAQVRVNSTKLYHQIMGLIDGMIKYT